jgi:uncharacterized protein (DUF2141 family)
MRAVTFIIFLFIVTSLKAQTNPGNIEIVITGTNFKKAGFLWIGLYDNKESFGKLDKAIQIQYVPVKNQPISIKFNNVKHGTYSVNVFHDENSNKDIDKNFIGIPKEGYGFSNNPKLFGPPSFEKTKFCFSQSILKMTINMCY